MNFDCRHVCTVCVFLCKYVFCSCTCDKIVCEGYISAHCCFFLDSASEDHDWEINAAKQKLYEMEMAALSSGLLIALCDFALP